MNTPATRLDWTLRLGAAMCFIGHGAFGVLTKASWLPYFAVAGLGPAAAFAWMPVIGAVDILLGCLVLFTPRPVVAAWMVGWAVWTALLRPLAGEAFAETLERAGNYGVPLALFLRMAPLPSWCGYFASAPFPAPTLASLRGLRTVLTITVVFLLVGHGVLSVGGKATFVQNLASLVPANAGRLLPLLGWLELALAALVAIRPSVPLALFIAVWKIATEALFLTAGAPAWEWIERGGSYAAPLALAIVLRFDRLGVKFRIPSVDH